MALPVYDGLGALVTSNQFQFSQVDNHEKQLPMSGIDVTIAR